MGERVLTVLDEIENLTAYGVDPEVVERIEEKYKAERENTFNYWEEKEKYLRQEIFNQDVVIKGLIEYFHFKWCK